MNRRAIPRLEINKPARLFTFGDTPKQFDVMIVDAHTRGMKVLMPVALTINQPVKIEYGESMILGEVCHLLPVADGQYHLGIQIQEILHGLGSLQHLIEALQSAETPSPVTERR